MVDMRAQRADEWLQKQRGAVGLWRGCKVQLARMLLPDMVVEHGAQEALIAPNPQFKELRIADIIPARVRPQYQEACGQ